MAMTIRELESEVMRLKEQVDELSRARDYLEIWKLMSTYSHLYHVFKKSEIVGLFARKPPGVVIEIEDSGVYEGLEGVKKVFGGFLSEKYSMYPGILCVHMTVNPIIEINKKGTRAKGLWHSHGSVTLRMGERLTSYWCLGKYDMEYVKEDGQWKFIKLVYRLTYMTPYEKGWVEEPQGVSIAAAHAQYPPDKPITYHMPYNRYRINVFQSPPPEPYID